MFLHNRLENLNNLFMDKEGGEGGGQTDQEKHDAHLRQAITERDEAKAKARETEKKLAEINGKLQEFEDNKKKETGEFQKLADEYKSKYESTLPELDKYKKDSEELTTYKENRKKTLLESIPEDKREEWKQSDLTTLEKVAVLFSGSLNIQVDDGKTGKKNGKIETAGKTWKDFSVDQLEEIKKQNPQEYDRLFRENGKVVI
jgi:hypothetical protein